MEFGMTRSLWLSLVLLCTVAAHAQGPGDPNYRWAGHDFVFCFITDDGRSPNLAWADVARDMDFRFTIAVNIQRDIANYPGELTVSDIQTLAADGFEIAQHGYSHGFEGLSETCPIPPRGSLPGYFLCDDVDPDSAMVYLHAEIERDSIATVAQVSSSAIRTVAYPRHRHTKAVIDSLISEGYIAARTGGVSDFDMNSFGDFDTQSRNGWETGISLFRVPAGPSDRALFGDHSADPPVHFTYEQFQAVAQARINYAKSVGSIFVLFTHHLGDDDDSYGDINYDSGGVTPQDLTWLVDLVRANNGAIMTFADAATYYRTRSAMFDIDGDYVWVPDGTDARDLPRFSPVTLCAYPNPFNPRTIIEGTLTTSGPASLFIYDASGARLATLMQGYLEAGLHSWPWDGRGDSGQLLGTGVYFAELRTVSGRATSRLLLLK
jgi:hypothetical protein